MDKLLTLVVAFYPRGGELSQLDGRSMEVGFFSEIVLSGLGPY